MRQFLILLCFSALLFSCGSLSDRRHYATADELFSQTDSILSVSDQYSDTVRIRYAKGLSVEYREDGIHVWISNPDPQASNHQKEEIVITAPSMRFMTTTALQLGNFEVLGLEDRVVAMNTLSNLFSEKVQQRVKDGSTVMVGKEGNFDVEMVLASRPDYIFVSASKNGGFEALKEAGIPLIPHHGYKEVDPLGQAEWIKLVGLLTGETRRANAVFDEIERKYLTLKQEAQNAVSGKDLPTVISGRQIRDGWYIVGGKSYMAQIFQDAGADYIMKDNQESGGVTLDFEAVYYKGMHADFWQTDSSFNGDFSLETLKAEDERYSTMDAFKNHRVLYCNLSRTPYRELAGVQPHLLLADFVKAFHAELLPNYTPKYYKLID